MNDTVIASRVRFLAVSEPRDRVAPDLWDGRFHRYRERSATGQLYNAVLNADSTMNVLVRFHSDVSDAAADQVMLSRSSQSQRAGRQYWRATITQQQLRDLAAIDDVRWIDAIPTGTGSTMDQTRAAINVNAVQTLVPGFGIVTGSNGANVRVGVFDEGIDTVSQDLRSTLFGTRVVLDRPEAHSHGTTMAGIIAGNGVRSAGQDSWGIANDGALYQWRGIAPNAELIDAPKLDQVGDMAPAPMDLRNYITMYKLALSNHSHGLSVDGSYDALNRVHDAIIRGDDAGDGAAIAPRLHVHSAGNYGKQPAVGNQRGFFSLNNQLKNALSVGNYYFAESRIASSSSLGPTYDGRIKPDVVAPGTFVTALGYCTTTDNPEYYAEWGGAAFHPCDNAPFGASFPRRNFYWQQTGTSAAAAVVSGVMTIVAGQLANTPNITLNPTAPLPSTLRAIAVHSAKDLTFAFETQDGADHYLSVQASAGPDFATGFGLIDAKAAIDVVDLRAVREDVIDATCATKTYTMNIPDDDYLLTLDGKIRITLAWDDPASDTPEIDPQAPRLINDLDVVLTAPDGTKHYPWLLDQQPIDADGNTLGDDAQACGMDVRVLRKLKATTAPVYDGDGAQTNVDDPITSEDVQPATTGKDHLNNVEQVSAPSMPGQWTIEVSGFNVDQGPQKFSLIGVPAPEINIYFEPKKFCQKFPMLCELRFALACIRFPLLCDRPFLMTVREEALPITFRDPADMRIIPIPALCNALGRYASCAVAGKDQPRPPLDIALVSGAEALRTEVLDARGLVLASDTTAAPSKRLHIPPSRYPTFLVITPRTGFRPGSEVLVPIRLSRSR